MKRKIKTSIEISEESGMPEIVITTFLDLEKKLKTTDILFIEEFCHKTGLDRFLEPKKGFREVYKTQRSLREMDKKENIGVHNA